MRMFRAQDFEIDLVERESTSNPLPFKSQTVVYDLVVSPDLPDGVNMSIDFYLSMGVFGVEDVAANIGECLLIVFKNGTAVASFMKDDEGTQVINSLFSFTNQDAIIIQQKNSGYRPIGTQPVQLFNRFRLVSATINDYPGVATGLPIEKLIEDII
jgi:hypothetical protein